MKYFFFFVSITTSVIFASEPFLSLTKEQFFARMKEEIEDDPILEQEIGDNIQGLVAKINNALKQKKRTECSRDIIRKTMDHWWVEHRKKFHPVNERPYIVLRCFKQTKSISQIQTSVGNDDSSEMLFNFE